jgi:RNA-directed DNA polymerase
LNTLPVLQTVIGKWLKAGIMENGELLYPEAGTPQGGVLSPLLANIALHGMETCASLGLTQRTNTTAPRLIRYADDFVLIHEDLVVIEKAKQQLELFLTDMGLKLKPSKTSMTHTLEPYEGKLGFDFLGFHIQQYKVGKYQTGRLMQGSQRNFKTLITPSKRSQTEHLRTLKQVIKQRCNAPTLDLIQALNPKIKGWANYYRSVVSARTFNYLDHQVVKKLMAWVRRRSKGSLAKAYHHYFALPAWRLESEGLQLAMHSDVTIQRHVKVKADRSPFDGDQLYWSTRLGRSLELPVRKAKLLKRQRGKCYHCGLFFSSEDVMEIHHLDRNPSNNHYANLALVMGHCHDVLHRGTSDKS